MFIELKFNSQKIKSKLILLFIISLFSNQIFAESNLKVLVMMSASDKLILNETEEYKTGVFLNELYHPVIALEKSNYQIVYATPNAVVAKIDPESLKLKYWESNEEKEAAVQKFNQDPNFLKPISLNEALTRKKEFVSILVPGGQGLMSDLLYDPFTPKILTAFHEDKKPIGLICHAPALLATIQFEESKDFLFAGYKVNSVTKIEEWFIETFVMKGKPKVRKISTLLKERGMIYKSSFLPGKSYAVRDRNLITSQNPFSGEEFIEFYLEAIHSYLQKP